MQLKMNLVVFSSRCGGWLLLTFERAACLKLVQIFVVIDTAMVILQGVLRKIAEKFGLISFPDHFDYR